MEGHVEKYSYRGAQRVVENFWRNRRASWALPGFARGCDYAESEALLCQPDDPQPRQTPGHTNPLWDFFSNRIEGPGIWKWEHYFDIYHRHLQRFVGTRVDLLEIGIFSGGSIDMWTSYLGGECHIYGVDIDPSCTAYERPNVSVLIGDQQDRSFWTQFKRQVSGVDILIDDGGHTPEQQMVTLEEMLPHVRPGGVYLCEDVAPATNDFAAFAAGLVTKLNAFSWDVNNHDGTGTVRLSRLQSTVYSVHFYPYVVVIEKHAAPQPLRFSSIKHGTEWNPAPYGR